MPKHPSPDRAPRPGQYRLRWFKAYTESGNPMLFVVAEVYERFLFWHHWVSVDGVRYRDEARARAAIEFHKCEIPPIEDVP